FAARSAWSGDPGNPLPRACAWPDGLQGVLSLAPIPRQRVATRRDIAKCPGLSSWRTPRESGRLSPLDKCPMTIRVLAEIELPNPRFFNELHDDDRTLAVELATVTLERAFTSIARVRITVRELTPENFGVHLVELLESRPLLTKAEVAAHYRVDVRTLNRWINDEQKHFPRPINDGLRWRPCDLEAYDHNGGGALNQSHASN